MIVVPFVFHYSVAVGIWKKLTELAIENMLILLMTVTNVGLQSYL